MRASEKAYRGTEGPFLAVYLTDGRQYAAEQGEMAAADVHRLCRSERVRRVDVLRRVPRDVQYVGATWLLREVFPCA